MLVTYSDLLRQGFLLFVTFFGSVVTALIVGITFHEFSHAFVADRLGDMTPRFRGRLSLNPARHLDRAGALFLLLVGFGWGKPVPVNPAKFRNGPQAGRAMVAAAGPLSNLLLAGIASIPIHLGLLHWWPPFAIPFSLRGWGLSDYASLYVSSIITFNVILAVFNFIPLAPLDGFSVAVGLLPRDLSIAVARLEPYGMGILLILLALPLVTHGNFGILYQVMSPAINGLTQVFSGSGVHVFT